MAEGVLSHIFNAATSWLTRRRERVKEQERRTQERHVVVALLGAELDRYSACCLEVSYDDGTTEGRPAGQDGKYHEATVLLPIFDPRPQNIELSCLPPDLIYAILDLPARAVETNHTLDEPGFADDPTDFPAYFQTRQLGYAELGLQAARLAQRLRQLIGVPLPTMPSGMRPREELLQERIEELEDKEIARNKRCLIKQSRTAH